jgi:hypothetical protein
MLLFSVFKLHVLLYTRKFDNIWQINMAALYSAAQSLLGQF